MYMKRILTILASVAMVMTAVSCNPEQTPSLSFGKAQYVLLADAPLSVDVVTDVAPAADLTVDLLFTGEAVVDADYTVSATSVVIPAGQAKGSVTITPLNNFEEGKNIIISMKVPTGYQLGKNATATVAVDAKEMIMYSFDVAQANVVDRYVVKLNLSGSETGTDWVATADMEIPYTATEGAPLTFADDVFVVKKGENVAKLVVNAGDVEGDPVDVLVSINAGERFVAGTNEMVTLTVSGLLKISSLLGTWEYNALLDLEDDGIGFFEYMYTDGIDDDYSLMPLDNEGFRLTFYEAEDEDGNPIYKVKPSGPGEWNDYFRDAVIDYRSPINMDEDGEITGPYSTIEYNDFAMLVYDEEPMVYFSLDTVNRAFSPSVENIGTGAIAMWVDYDGMLVISFKDYDQPPFASYWWEDPDPTNAPYGDMFSSMFSLASTFVKVTDAE